MKPWSEVTEDEINKVIMRDCRKCRYSAASVTGSKKETQRLHVAIFCSPGKDGRAGRANTERTGYLRKRRGRDTESA